ncbi:hypothetical protein A3F62_04805 [Candidatus Woesebacteria bacterium RIFCSPHIGHO2_12_FULL_44_11]|nr:MAG: hypothetical protein A3F62_04805 [Candidatus Woesebacteria bacterium RIFCSPHIGHO2_12_FULL_44_11]
METGETQTPSQPQQLQQPPERGSGQEKEKLKIRVFDEQTKSSLVHFGYSVVQLDDESLQRIAKAAREPKSLKTVVQESFSTLSPTILTSESMLGLHPLRNTEIAFRAEQIYVPQSNLKDYWEQERLINEELKEVRARLGVKKLKAVIPDASTVGYLEFAWRTSTGEDLIPPGIFIRTNTIRDTLFPGLYYAVGRHSEGQDLQVFEYPMGRKHSNIYAPAIFVPKRGIWN